VVTDVFSCDDLRVALLRRLGFVEDRLWDHITERDLGGPIGEPDLPDGFTIRPASIDDVPQLAEVRNDAFDAGWSPEQYRDEVMLKPGYRPERELLVIAPDGRVAAFTVTWLDVENRLGLFEPVGTHSDFRRMGLARALMLHALAEMKALGMETATVEHLADNMAARELYRGLGFEKRFETVGYTRG
jgi:ribosomal protein S18 acetylase RimI-like enzyme